MKKEIFSPALFLCERIRTCSVYFLGQALVSVTTSIIAQKNMVVPMVGLGLLVVAYAGMSSSALGRSTAQYVLFLPVLALFGYTLRQFGVSRSTLLRWGGFVLVVTGIQAAMFYGLLWHGAFLLFKFHSDEDFVRSRSFQSLLNSHVLESPLSFTLLGRSPASVEGTRGWLTPGVTGVVVDQGGELLFHLANSLPVRLGVGIISAIDRRESSLKVVNDFTIFPGVSQFSVPHRPQDGSASFVAHFASALKSLTEQITLRSAGSGEQQSAPQIERELSEKIAAELLIAASTDSPFSSKEHLGAAYFFLGNFYLNEAHRNGEKGELRCALAAYQRASKFVVMGKNPELYWAIQNNYAVALAMQYGHSRERKLLVRGLKQLQTADWLSNSAGTGSANGYLASAAIAENIKLLRQLAQAYGKPLRSKPGKKKRRKLKKANQTRRSQKQRQKL